MCAHRFSMNSAVTWEGMNGWPGNQQEVGRVKPTEHKTGQRGNCQHWILRTFCKTCLIRIPSSCLKAQGTQQEVKAKAMHQFNV